jgi:alcohol dehydrogenase
MVPFSAEAWPSAPAVDFAETEKGYEVTAELPGMDEKNIEVKFADGVLTIKGEKQEEKEEKKKDYYMNERSFGSFHRALELPNGIDQDKIEASFKNGVLISSCGKCDYCRRGMYSHCINGGWILGNKVDGTQAEYVRTPFADTSLCHIPSGADEDALVMLSDILPTGFECGVLNGKVEPGSTIAIVGAGPIGLAALLTAQFYSPASIIMIDLDDNRLQLSSRFGATSVINNTDGTAVEKVMQMTGGRGVDTAIEAVGVPASFITCEDIVAPGGVIANIGVHGVKADLHLERLWDRNIAITTRLVDTVTTPMLLKTVQSRRIDPQHLITHRFKFDKILDAYDTFAAAAKTHALKVLIEV